MSEKKKSGLDLLGGIFKGLNINIDELLNAAEKLANLKGDERAKEDVRKMREGIGKTKDISQSDVQTSGLEGLFKGILNFVEKASKEGGEFTQKFAGGKGMIQGGIRGHILGIPLGGKDLPLDRRAPAEKFTVKCYKPDKRTEKKPAIKENPRELELDVFDEKDHILVIGEMPGVTVEEIKYKVKGNLLTIWTEGNRKYHKEVELPALVTEKITLNYRNRVLEVKLAKKN